MYYLSRADKLFVTMLADHCEYGRANVFAQNLLSMLFGYEYEMCDNTTRSTRANHINPVEIADAIQLGNPFPNPATKQLFVPYQCPFDVDVTIQITDISGRVINTDMLTKGENMLELNLGTYTPGMYQIKFTFGNKHIQSIKFVKQ